MTLKRMAGVAGFEPATFGPRAWEFPACLVLPMFEIENAFVKLSATEMPSQLQDCGLKLTIHYAYLASFVAAATTTMCFPVPCHDYTPHVLI